MWHNNKQVLATFIHYTTQWSWAYIDGLGWRRIKDGAGDGVTNLTILFNTARASSRPVNVYIDGSDLILTAYLL
jgi:hypothetical protein